ncbi:MAG TPA: hypothetical protein VJN94_04790 [Candidatus Binataceae bacterium]|nr:hypothetical protein [Candidatus Binataceae bacterium]
MHAYSSMTAFIAHYRWLSEAEAGGAASQLLPAERQTLAVMRTLIGELTPDERAALFEHAHDEPNRRQYERASLKLRRVLLAEGVLQG